MLTTGSPHWETRISRSKETDFTSKYEERFTIIPLLTSARPKQLSHYRLYYGNWQYVRRAKIEQVLYFCCKIMEYQLIGVKPEPYRFDFLISFRNT